MAVNRWQLHRAGIVNVYQYDDETLHFEGGRLLLRGVNGSGKSTAMNMLLPFLLEADTRRIDAAGEQSAVLKSWMLTGRDEPNPVGYLWVEFRGPNGDYLTFGCGIRANRSSDRVTTWWFITPQRPGIDFELVEHRVPLSHESLRAALRSEAVFGHDQRPAYREAVRKKLFGGADPDQHFRLLHIIRNPRVGDRIDVELPNYLSESLPQLSQAALDDAAQPLEELEEHRRNVADLTRTAAALEGLGNTYGQYARRTIHTAADGLLSRVGEVKRHRSEAAKSETSASAAALARDEQQRGLDSLDERERSSRSELDGLSASEHYREGRRLDDRRKRVDSLAKRVGDAESRHAHDNNDLARSTADVERQATAAESDANMLGRVIAGQQGDIRDVKLSSAAPQMPPYRAQTSGDIAIALPPPSTGCDELRASLGEVRMAISRRQQDVDDAEIALSAIDGAEAALTRAEERRDDYTAAFEVREVEATSAHQALLDAAQQWNSAVHSWVERTRASALKWQLSDELTDITGDLALAERAEITAQLAGVIDSVQTTLQQRLVQARHRGELQAAELQSLVDQMQLLLANPIPPSPALAWQSTRETIRFADLVDFRDNLDHEMRAGLEAALEASGILSAVISITGDAVADTGELLVTAKSPRAAMALDEHFTVTVPDDCDVPEAAVTSLLRSISSVPATDNPATDNDVHIATDGSFRIGPLSGRHHKDVAEHIGLTARKAAFEKRRAALQREIDAATERVDDLRADTERAEQQAADALQIRADVPSTVAVDDAARDTAHADRLLDEARVKRYDAIEAVRVAETAHAEKVSAWGRMALERSLPNDRGGLAKLKKSLHAVSRSTDDVESRSRALDRSHATWCEAAERWQRADARHKEGLVELEHRRREHDGEAQSLAALDASIGAEYRAVVERIERCQTELDETLNRLQSHRNELERRIAAAATARSLADTAMTTAQQAEVMCLNDLPSLRDVLDVAGLTQAALDGTDSEAVTIATTARDAVEVEHIARALLSSVPAPDRANITEDSVRQSLRQRRDQLSGGWDVEDRQSGDGMPISINVTGPLGRAPLAPSLRNLRAQLDQQAGLLTAKQDQALRNLLQGLLAKEVARKRAVAEDLVDRMNARLSSVTTSHGVGVTLRWRRRDDLDERLASIIDLLSREPDLRTTEDDAVVSRALSAIIDEARQAEPETPYGELLRRELDYRNWHEMTVLVRRPGHEPRRLNRRTPLSEGEKKLVSYLPLFAAAAASADALAETEPAAPRFVLLDDAFAKVSIDNHPGLFGLLVELDLDWIATSERLWGTFDTVPELSITEVLRDASLGTIALVHFRWDGTERHAVT